MKLIVVFSSALGAQLFGRYARAPFWKCLHTRELDSFFPALSAPAQAAFRTAAGVDVHGMGANGFFDRSMKRVFLREQASTIYGGKRIWEEFRARGGKVAQICMQQCQGLDSDLYLSPAPIITLHGGVIQDMLSQPEDLYQTVCEENGGREFNLMHVWGPFPSAKASRWIASATETVAKRLAAERDALILTCLPHLDSDPQRDGPESSDTEEAFEEYEECADAIFHTAQEHGFELLILGDYEITDASNPVFPNKVLASEGFLKLREVEGGMLYPNFHSSRAFALADHQICHIYIADPAKDQARIQALFEALPGVSCVIRRSDAPEWDHPRCGELILEAEPGAWFAYHWWEDPDQAPDYATHIGFRSKPGVDPMEFHWKIWPPLSVPLDCSLLRGTYGRQCKVIGASTFMPDSELRSFSGMAEFVRDMLRS